MKKLLYLFCASLLVLTSCSGDDSKEDTSNNDSVLPKKGIIKDDDTSSDFFEYSYNRNKLIRITPSFSKNGSFDFTYNGDLINGSKRYDDNKAVIFEMFYEYDSKQRLVNEKMLSKFDYSGHKRVFVYNLDGTISFTEYIGDLITQDRILLTGKIWLNDEGETLKIEEYMDDTLLYKTEYTYDDKNNVFKNILGYSKINLLGELGKIHNILTCKKYNSNNVLSYGYSNKYSYNSANYPVSVVKTFEDGGVGNSEWVY